PAVARAREGMETLPRVSISINTHAGGEHFCASPAAGGRYVGRRVIAAQAEREARGQINLHQQAAAERRSVARAGDGVVGILDAGVAGAAAVPPVEGEG